ncbi:MAG: shikimate dehydrogenase, partial [Elusimicrobiota bacterium]|nr:shikimate dehydrogenase [Elusimicrobiota bacterium]
KALNIVGINVTVPHKEKICSFLDKLHSSAEKIRAVNTVVQKDGKLIGYNTDGIGFVKSLKGKFNPEGKNVFLLGAGGAGRAIASALVESKVRKIFIYDTNIQKAKKLVGDIECEEKFEIVSKNEFEKTISRTDLLVNATPVGMNPVTARLLSGTSCRRAVKESSSPIDTKLLHKGLFVYDIVYNRKTELIKNAEKIGARTLTGLEMLLYQGAAAFELWTHRKAPIEIMRKSLETKEVKIR